MEGAIKNYGIFGNINSEYMLRFIFSFLWENKKLDIISYNKQIQIKLKVNIDDYKAASNKEKIVEKNGIVKEYVQGTNILIFEGEYKNGKKNGKGKEYYDSEKIKFDGEYLNGKKISGKKYDEDGHVIFVLENGKGEEYNSNRGTIFEGEYFDGRKWNGIGYYFKRKVFEMKYGKGTAIEFDYYGNIIFEGEYLNGYPNGEGKEYYKNGKLKFEGNYLNGNRIKGNKYDKKGNIILIEK